MSDKRSRTKREHFIPQFYLKHWRYFETEDMIIQYQIGSLKTPKPVPIKSICQKEDLYEYHDEEGRIVLENSIEKCLAALEGIFSEVTKSIESKASNKCNYDTLCFLSCEEKVALIVFVATLVLRDPDILEIAKSTAMEFYGEYISDNIAYNKALKACLPVDEIFDSTNRNVLNSLIFQLVNMTFQVGISQGGNLLTSDKPVILLGKMDTFKIEEVMFPELLTNPVLHLDFYSKK